MYKVIGQRIIPKRVPQRAAFMFVISNIRCPESIGMLIWKNCMFLYENGRLINAIDKEIRTTRNPKDINPKGNFNNKNNKLFHENGSERIKPIYLHSPTSPRYFCSTTDISFYKKLITIKRSNLAKSNQQT